MEYRILGSIEVRVNGHVVSVGGPRQRRILAALLLRRNQVVPVSRLVEMVWDGDAPEAARRQVQNRVAALRSTLTRLGGSVSTEGGGYRLSVQPGQADVDRFDDLVRRGRAAGDATLLRQALTVWRGPALSDVDGDLIGREAAALEERRLAVVEECLALELDGGYDGDLTAELMDLVAEHPLRERLLGLLIRALCRSGRQAEAAAAYNELATRLADELGVSPSAELRRIHESVLCGGEVLEASDKPETGKVTPSQVPAGVSGFTGRRAEVETLDRWLAEGQTERVVVISAIAGTAGVGKTALAVHWAHRARDRFPDGQLHVNLRGYALAPPVRPIDALAGFLRALGVPGEQIPTKVDEAAAKYRSLLADKRILVVLDNAADADQVRPLLPPTSGSLALVTSRDALSGLVARDGARRLVVDVLTPQEADALLARLLGDERVGAEPEAAAKLARLCAYLPLALRIAAASILEGETIGAYVARLAAGNAVEELAVDGDEQAAVRVAFDLSYASLSVPARRLFRLLGLHPGPDITAEGAAALSGTTSEEAKASLGQLATAHLTEQHLSDRYALHDLLRAYAHRRAAAEETKDERDTALTSLCRWYLRNAAHAGEVLYPQLPRLATTDTGSAPFTDSEQARFWLDAERSNLVAAVLEVTSSSNANQREAGYLLADVLRGYFWLTRNTVEWLRTAEAALRGAEVSRDVRAQAALHLSLGLAHQCLTDLDRAIRHTATAVSLSEDANWDMGLAAALGNLGMAHTHSGHFASAAECYQKAITVYERACSSYGVAIQRSNLGQVNIELGRLGYAIEQLTAAVELHQENRSQSSEAFTRFALGNAHQLAGDPQQAAGHLDAALSLSQQTGSVASEALSLIYLAALECDCGDLSAALAAGETARALVEASDDRFLQIHLNVALGAIHDRLGAHAEARERLQATLELAENMGINAMAAETGVALAVATLNLGQSSAAADHAVEALRLARQYGYRLREGQALSVLADVHLHQGDSARAEELARAALEIHRETGHRLGEARTLRTLSRTVSEPEATRHRDAAVQLFVTVGARTEADELRQRR